MKNLIGKKVRGFKFEGRRGHIYNQRMDRYVGEVGKIEEYNDKDEFYQVTFKDAYWWYPAELIEQHLLENESTNGCKIIVNESIVSSIVDSYFNGTSLPQIRESIRQAYIAIEAGVNAQLVEIKEERGKL